MQNDRLPRFKRVSTLPPIEITERDREIIRLVNRHRFLRSSHITAFIDSNAQPIVRRLQLLYHHGYLERPRCQLDYYYQSGSRSIIYGIGTKGANLLVPELGIPMRKIRWGEKNRSVGRVYLEHALLVSDLMVAIELACRKHENIRVIGGNTLLKECGRSQFRWRVRLSKKLNLGLIPDLAFALEINGNRTCFFLEADQGTMPVIRNNLVQSSLYRKLLTYEATWEQSIHQTRFGFNRFRVIFLTKSQERVKSLVNACGKLNRGHGLFLIADRTILNDTNILSAPWYTGRPDQTSTLLD